MRFLVVDTYYGVFLGRFYAENSTWAGAQLPKANGGMSRADPTSSARALIE
jgi:hypothetical protein